MTEATELTRDQARHQRRMTRLRAARLLGRHTERQWNDLVWSTGHRCAYCKRKTGTSTRMKDHRIPLARGGSDAIENIAVACRWCNYHKATMTDVEFIAHLKRTGLGKLIAKQRLLVDPRWRAKVRARRAVS